MRRVKGVSIHMAATLVAVAFHLPHKVFRAYR
jgi:hypothetical protein